MKRKRNSMAIHTKRNKTKRGEFSHITMNNSGSSISDLPKDIMVNVLLRLSIKRIFVCKLVCKTWHDLISEPAFAKLHFDQAQAYPLINFSDFTIWSRMLYLVQPDEEKFELKLEMCKHSEFKQRCDCLVSFGLDTKFKLPFRNVQRILDSVSDKSINLRMTDHRYSIVNSCNGMLCLSNPFNNGPLVVCNPVTGEFINLPDSELEKANLSRTMLCGFGFSPAANQYKVIKMYPDPSTYNKVRVKIHTIGTETWKDLEFPTQELNGLDPISLSAFSLTGLQRLCPIYLNGFLYWYRESYRTSPFVLSFDIENEVFRKISTETMKSVHGHYTASLGVFGEELSISCYVPSKVNHVWVLKDCGTKNVWSKVLSFRTTCCYGPWEPIKYVNDGALLLFNPLESMLLYKHPRKHRIRYFKFHSSRKTLDVIAHIPSFISLREIAPGLEVLKPRCAQLKLKNEDKGFSLRERRAKSCF